MGCARCGNMTTRPDGQARLGEQRWRCGTCRRRFTARSASAFSGHTYLDDFIASAVRRYVRYRLSYADVAEWLAERGIAVDRSTLCRRVQRFLRGGRCARRVDQLHDRPRFVEAARAHRTPVDGRWLVDETSCRLSGPWACLYRALDQHGQVVDVSWSTRRNAAAA